MNQSKETIYIDIDEDITGIIDRVVSSKNTIVAAVLPKRAGMLHSSVNMRLLKRAAEEAGKSLVLITAEAPVLKLAGLTRVHVAKSLTTKPYLPDKPESEVTETIVSEPVEEPKVDPDKSIGELAGDKVSVDEPKKAEEFDEDTIELDNLEPEGTEQKESEPKTKKDKKLSVPSFDKFRKRIFIYGGIGLGLIIFLFFAIFVWPRATITIATEKSNVETRLDFTVNIAQAQLDETAKILPAEQKEVKATLTEKFTATGKQDNGSKATGKMTLTNCIKDDNTHAIPAGTSFTSNGFTFISTSEVVLPVSTFQGNTCKSATVGDSKDVNVTAASGGDNYNLNSRSYAASISGIDAYGSAMSGGTSKIVTVVSADDVEEAKKKILAKSTDEYKSQLAALFKDTSKFGLTETLTSIQGEVTSAPKVGEEATAEATLSIAFTYQMLGVKLTDIEKILANAQNLKIDTNKQKIYDSGVDVSKIGQLERPSAGEAKMNLSGTGIAGPKLDAETIAHEVAGKSGGETKQIISSRPDIASVQVKYDPFWVFSTPKKVSRITIIFDATN
jgi:hypothetical protein